MIELGGGNDWEALAVAAYHAGYAGTNDITVEVSQQQFFRQHKTRIENFVTFLLNEEGAAEKEFDVNIQFEQTQKPASKVRRSVPKSTSLLSFSGGLDSLASYYLMDDPLCVFVDYGQGHLEREREMVKMVAGNRLVEARLPSAQEIADEAGNPDDAWPVDGFKIPCRNFVFFATLSSFMAYGGGEPVQMAIGAYQGEIKDKNRDKSPRFFTTLSGFFTDYFNTPVNVGTPVGNMSKVDVANVLSDRDVDPWQIPFCDAGDRCADCKSCFNFALAIELSDVEIDDPYYRDWLNDLLESDIAAYYRNNLDQYHGERREQLEVFLQT